MEKPNEAAAKAWAALSKNEKMVLARENFEKTFGVDQATRKPSQWKALVATYGMQTVCAMENMTQPEVLQRCNETFSNRLDRQLKDKRIK